MSFLNSYGCIPINFTNSFNHKDNKNNCFASNYSILKYRTTLQALNKDTIISYVNISVSYIQAGFRIYQFNFSGRVNGKFSQKFYFCDDCYFPNGNTIVRYSLIKNKIFFTNSYTGEYEYMQGYYVLNNQIHGLSNDKDIASFVYDPTKNMCELTCDFGAGELFASLSIKDGSCPSETCGNNNSPECCSQQCNNNSCSCSNCTNCGSYCSGCQS
jgi:hypothetical protein